MDSTIFDRLSNRNSRAFSFVPNSYLMSADNISLNSGSGGDTVRADDVSGIKYQYIKVAAGGDNTAADSGVTVYKKVSVGTSGDAANIKASAGVVYSVLAVNTDTTTCFLHLYNTASAPTVGTTGTAITMALPPSGGVAISLNHGWKFDTGIGIGIATTVGGSTGVTADKVTVAIGYV
jgi:hypothetical protein